jgi:hypothetical protein
MNIHFDRYSKTSLGRPPVIVVHWSVKTGGRLKQVETNAKSSSRSPWHYFPPAFSYHLSETLRFVPHFVRVYCNTLFNLHVKFRGATIINNAFIPDKLSLNGYF